MIGLRTATLAPLVLAVVVLAGCGGTGGDAPAPAPATPPAPAPVVEPPPTQDLDVQPGTVTIGDQQLSATLTTANLLPPNAFGTVSSFEATVTMPGASQVSANLSAVRFTTSDGHWLQIQKNADGSVSWSTDAGAISANTVTDPATQCNLMSSNLAALIPSGAAVGYTWSGPSITSAPTTFSSALTVSLSIQPPASSPCPPAAQEVP